MTGSQQAGMFPSGEDTPLFSGTPQTVKDERYTPKPVPPKQLEFINAKDIWGRAVTVSKFHLESPLTQLPLYTMGGIKLADIDARRERGDAMTIHRDNIDPDTIPEPAPEPQAKPEPGRCKTGATLFKDWQVVKTPAAWPQALEYADHQLECETCLKYDMAGSYSIMHPPPQDLLTEAAPHIKDKD